MKRFSILICVFLIFGHLLLEAGAAYQKYKGFERIYIDPFLSGSYEWYDTKGIDIYYWVQMNCTEFLWCISFFVLAMIAKQYSFRLFRVGCIFFSYHVIDWFMLWWDYKTSNLFYVYLNGAILISIVVLFFPERERGVVKSMQ